MKSTMGLQDIPEWVTLLVLAGQKAPSADNSQPWRFVWDGKSLSVCLDPIRAGKGLGLNHPANLMAIGAVIENLAQAAANIGLPADAINIRSERRDDSFATITLDTPIDLPATELKSGLFGRHTNRGPFQRTSLPQSSIDQFASMTEGPLRTVVVSDPDSHKRLSAMLRDASEVRFQTEEIHRWLGASLRFTPDEIDRGDGLDVATLLLPPGAGGLLKLSLDWRRMSILNRFGAYKLFAFLEASMLRHAGALILVVGPPQGGGAEVAAGRLLERLWIALNDSGLAVHPYYVLSDQLYRLRAGLLASQFRKPIIDLSNRVTSFLGGGDETIFMLFRVGVPKIKNPARSRRLPTGATFVGLNT